MANFGDAKLKLVKEVVEKTDWKQVKVRAGPAFDFEKMKDADITKLTQIAICQCLNGPVGVHKSTKYPFDDSSEYTVAAIAPGITNRHWKCFCMEIAGSIPQNDETKACYCYTLFQSFWPYCDGKFVAKKK